MKKNKNILKMTITTLCIIVLSIILMLLGANIINYVIDKKTSSDEEYLINTIKDKTNVDFNKCKLIKHNNTHGGFLGDGTTQKIYDCNNQKISKKALSKELKKLPLSKNIHEVNDMFKSSDKDEFNLDVIDEIENGSYFFVDNFTQFNENDKDLYSDKYLLTRPSYNYSLGVYDYDTKIFYYFEIDT